MKHETSYIITTGLRLTPPNDNLQTTSTSPEALALRTMASMEVSISSGGVAGLSLDISLYRLGHAVILVGR